MTRPATGAGAGARALRRRTATVLLAAAAATALGQAGWAPTAGAETPQQRAAALAAQVHSLQESAEADSEAYDAAQAELAQVVSAQLDAEASLTDAQRSAEAASAGGDEALRSLYEMGGPSVLLTSALTSGGDVLQVQARLIAARRIVEERTAAATRSGAAAQVAARAALAAADLATRKTALQAELAARGAAVTQELATTQALLGAANAQVAALAAADEARREAADQARFIAELTAAHAGPQAVPGALGNAPASSPVAAAALTAAESLEGHPYLWGGTGPIGYDCSGTTQAAYGAAGVRLPRTAAEQYGSGPHVALADLAPGDLLFWASDPADPTTIHHVAIYAGGGMMVSADHTGDTVRLQPVWWDGYAGATRPTVG